MHDRIRVAQFVAALLGLLIATYLTLYHYAGIPLVCSSQGLINCESVLNSPYAYLFGLPIAVYGIVFFVGEFVALLTKHADVIAIWNLIGVGSVVYFVYLERMIGKICIWCTGVHVIVVFLFGVSAYQILKKDLKYGE